MTEPEETPTEDKPKTTAPVAQWPGKGGRGGKDINPPGGWRVKKPGQAKKKKAKKK